MYGCPSIKLENSSKLEKDYSKSCKSISVCREKDRLMDKFVVFQYKFRDNLATLMNILTWNKMAMEYYMIRFEETLIKVNSNTR